MTNFKNYFPPYFLYLLPSVEDHSLLVNLPVDLLSSPVTPLSLARTLLEEGVSNAPRETLVVLDLEEFKDGLEVFWDFAPVS